jgi:hypothetical protein
MILLILLSLQNRFIIHVAVSSPVVNVGKLNILIKNTFDNKKMNNVVDCRSSETHQLRTREESPISVLKMS